MINKKLIHFNTYSAFEANKSQLYDWTIAFIGETKQIYTHGNFYDCNIANIVALQEELERIESSIPTKVSQLENDKNYIENGDGYESGVYIAVQSGKLIDPNEYDNTTETAVGVAVIDPKANFIIGLNHTTSIRWGTEEQGLYKVDISGLTNYTNSTTATTDMDGVANTNVITAIYSGTDCAAGLAKNSEQLLFGEDSLDPYLGSAGEWKIVINNYNAVKSAVATIGGNVLQSTSSLQYWTSTEYSSSVAWVAYFSSGGQFLSDDTKGRSGSDFCVVPFYKMNNETTMLSKINLITTPAGSSTAPIYIDSNGNIVSTTYGGGTKVTLNGSAKGGLNASFYAPTSAGTSGYILKSNGSGAPTWIAKTITFTNVSASSWVDDTTYEDYPYKCDVSCSGVTSSYYAEVVFDTAEALSGNYAPVCSTGSSIVTIYSKVNDAITIPTIFATLS